MTTLFLFIMTTLIETATLTVESPAFGEKEYIPEKYTCKGANISPPISIKGIPKEAKTLALIMDDPDAPVGTWVHWVLFNIPTSSRGLTEAIPSEGTLSDGSMNGKNSGGNLGYSGPCPPSGTHRYFFKLYALDEMLGLSSGADKGELLKAMEGHILAQGELMGTFSK